MRPLLCALSACVALAINVPCALAQGGPAAAPAAKAQVNLDASKVTLDVKDRPLGEVVELIAKQSGNRPLAMADALKDRRVTLAVKDASYWEATDAACESAGVAYAPDPQTRTVGLRELVRLVDIGARTGPFSVKVDRGSVTREFRMMKGPGGDTLPSAGGLTYNLTAYWEDRLPALSVEIEIPRALTADGKNLREGARPAVMLLDPRRARLQGYAVYLLHLDLPEAAGALLSFEGVVRASFAFGEKTLKIENILAPQPKPAAADGVSISIEQAQRDGNRVSVVVTAKREERSAPANLSPADAQKTFYLAGPDGKRYPVWLAGGSGPGKDDPAAKGPQAAEISLLFRDVPDVEGLSLIFLYPEKVETREYPLRIRDVPLP